MKVISSKAHGIIDYLFVIFLAASPTLFQMEGTLCTVTYALAGIHLLLTIATDFEVGLIKLIPFRIHGLLEMVVSIILAFLAFWFYRNDDTTGFYFYMGLAIVIMLVFVLTDFKTLPGKKLDA